MSWFEIAILVEFSIILLLSCGIGFALDRIYCLEQYKERLKFDNRALKHEVDEATSKAKYLSEKNKH